MRARHLEPVYQFNGHLNTLALDNARRLEDVDITILETKRSPEILIEGINFRRLLGEIMHIGDNDRFNAPASLQAPLGDGVEGDVLNAWQLGWEGSVEQVHNGIGLVTLAFPVEVMVMSDGVDAQFGDQTRQAHTQRQVHGDGEGG